MSVNPLHLCYASTANVDLYAAPSVAFVAGPNSRDHDVFKRARAAGAEVYAYLAIIAVPDTAQGLQRSYYMADPARVPLWGNGRKSWPNTMMADIRVGSVWSDWNISFIGQLIRGGEVDGVFLDSLGCRPWGKIVSWETWPRAERDEWTAGAVDIVRRLDTLRRAENDEFKIITNNIWHEAEVAEQYIDGVCIESPPMGAGQFHSAYVQRAFSALGHRRVMVIADTEAEAKLWATSRGVTHVTAVNRALGQDYQAATPPVVRAVDTRLPELRAAYQRRQREITDLASAFGGAQESIRELTRTKAQLIGKVRAMATYVAEQAEGVE